MSIKINDFTNADKIALVGGQAITDNHKEKEVRENLIKPDILFPAFVIVLLLAAVLSSCWRRSYRLVGIGKTIKAGLKNLSKLNFCALIPPASKGTTGENF